MKNLAWSVGILIIIIAAIFLLTNQNGPQNDTVIPSPIPVESPSLGIMPDESTMPSQQLSFPILKAEIIKGKMAKLVTKKGNVIIELSENAPIASSNFIFLTNKNFYDGLTFHRREEGFVIQGGDPKGNGTGGPGYQFLDEPVTEEYKRGIVAMANAGPNTNGSQFFILLGDALQLPKSYTIFGRVVNGMDVVDKISVGDVMTKVSII